MRAAPLNDKRRLFKEAYAPIHLPDSKMEKKKRDIVILRWVLVVAVIIFEYKIRVGMSYSKRFLNEF